MKYIKTLFSILSWPVYLVIIAYLLIAAPMALGYRPAVVLSGSMEPTFPVGSIIYYKAAPFDSIEVGDAITFHAGDGGSLVTHRVVEKQEISQNFVTKGDANETADPNPVAYGDVAGKTWSLCIPYAGYFVTYGKQPPVIGVMAAILILGILLDNVKTKGRPENDEEPK